MLATSLLALAAVARAGEADRIHPPYLPDAQVVVDGRLDEPAWAMSPAITEFLSWYPSDGERFEGLTEVRVWYDDRRLYFGFRCEDPRPEAVRAHVVPRELIDMDDQVAVVLDPFLERRGGYAFWANALGIQQDFRDDVDGDFSLAWNAVWSSKGVRTAEGYTVEVAIPWKSLPHPRDEEQTWGVMFSRRVGRQDTYYGWPDLNPDQANLFLDEGELLGLRPPTRALRLELIPTLTAGRTWSASTPGDPLVAERGENWTDTLSPGLDLRFGPTPDITVDATVNPDFSQIEADPFLLDLNLRYALFLEERRPFFLDGGEFYEDPQETLYSRAVVDPLWGFKTAGRTGAWRVGLLHAYDAAPEASLVVGRDTPGFGSEDLVDRGALDTVLRVERPVGGTLQVGLVFAEKDIVEAGFSGIPAHNRAGGLDVGGTLGERWALQAQALGSMTAAGDEMLLGSSVFALLERKGRAGWLGSTSLYDRSGDFRSETAYQDRAGYSKVKTWQAYRFEPASVVYFQPGLMVEVKRDRDPALPAEWWAGGDIDSGIAANMTCHAGIGQGGELYAGELFDIFGGWAGCNAEPAGFLSVEGEVSGGQAVDYAHAEPAEQVTTTAAATVRPAPAVQVEANWDHQSLWEEQGPALYHLNLYRAEGNFQFTAAWGFRLIGQWRDDDGSLQGSALLSWLPSPGTSFFLGFSESRVLGEDGGLSSRSAFAKVSGLFRP